MAIEVEYVPEKAPLTRAEHLVAAFLPRGLTIKEMAESLHRSVKTVETHLGHIYQKLDVQNDKQAITVMFLRGIVRAKNTLVLCLIVSMAEQALIPAKAVARDLAPVPQLQGHLSPIEQAPEFIRIRGRSRTRVRTGSRFSRRGRRRANECFMDVNSSPLSLGGGRFFLPGDK